jgi:hypothetical protein
MSALLLLLLCVPASAQTPKAVAGSVVRSKEWVVRRGKAPEEEFIGDVRYESAGTRLTADWALYRQTANAWWARGHIDARREFPDGDVIEARGENAGYNQTSLDGTLDPVKGGRVTLLRTSLLRDPDRGEADRFTWKGQSMFTLAGRARGSGPRGEFWADAARYELAPTKSLTLTGRRPLLHVHDDGVDAVLNGERIHDIEDPRRADADGRVLGWIITQSTVARPGDGPRCERDSRSGSPGPDARITALLTPPAGGETVSDAKLFDAEETAFSARACPWGPRAEFWADTARYEELPDRRLTLTGGQAALRKRDDDWSTALKADRIVATGSPRRVTASGKVRGWLQFRNEEKYERRKK